MTKLGLLRKSLKDVTTAPIYDASLHNSSLLPHLSGGQSAQSVHTVRVQHFAPGNFRMYICQHCSSACDKGVIYLCSTLLDILYCASSCHRDILHIENLGFLPLKSKIILSSVELFRNLSKFKIFLKLLGQLWLRR